MTNFPAIPEPLDIPQHKSLSGNMILRSCSLMVVVGIAIFGLPQTANAQNVLRIRDICRLKGQETNTLQGIGLVVGLKGTGDGDSKPMSRALARMMSLMGAPIASDVQGQLLAADAENSKNVALVFVTATVPASGSQPGDRLDCTISSIKAKSLEGGQLLLTPLLGPRSDTPTVYALASGPLKIENIAIPTTGKVPGGCKMEVSVETSFLSEDVFTLILEPEHSSFGTAQYLEDRINEETQLASFNSPGDSQIETAAKAIDQMHVQVRVPTTYRQRPVQYISLMLDLPVVNLRGNKRVVIREREGVVVIGEDVTISPVAISHKNLTISTGGNTPTSGGTFKPVSTEASGTEQPTLQNLVKALNVLDVPTEDVIAIIKALKSQGNLYGELVIE